MFKTSHAKHSPCALLINVFRYLSIIFLHGKCDSGPCVDPYEPSQKLALNCYFNITGCSGNNRDSNKYFFYRYQRHLMHTNEKVMKNSTGKMREFRISLYYTMCYTKKVHLLCIKTPI